MMDVQWACTHDQDFVPVNALANGYRFDCQQDLCIFVFGDTKLSAFKIHC